MFLNRVLRVVVGVLLVAVSIAAVSTVFKANTTHAVTVTETLTTTYTLTGYREGPGLTFTVLGLVVFAAGASLGLLLIMPHTKWARPGPDRKTEKGADAD